MGAGMELPKSVAEIADVIGRDRALYLVGQLPRYKVRDGRGSAQSSRLFLYVPTRSRLTPEHELVGMVGWHDAEKLSRHFGGELLHPAPCAEIYRRFRDQSICDLLSDGLPVDNVARIIGVSERHVRNVARENPHKVYPAIPRQNAA